MRTRNFTRVWPAILAIGLAFSLPETAQSFPPAPPHVIYGLIRDEQGSPLAGSAAKVILETPTGTQITSDLIQEAGVNYRLTIPMDSGLTADAYKPTALQPTAPFRLKVQIGSAVYLPLEMTGDFSHLGKPAQSTRIDLTLGEDSDHDGLPDAWERNLIAMLGGNLTLADIRPGDDNDHDGISNLNEYVAGTYAYDPADGFKLKILGYNNGAPAMEFLAIRGHNYTVYGSTNLTLWNPVQFKITAEGPEATTRQSYQATDVRTLRIDAVLPVGVKNTFYKVQVQ
jgi:hypothetical protein